MTTSPDQSRKGLRSVPRNVWALGLTSLFTDVSSEMVLNLVPLFLFNVLGVKTNLIGLIEGIAETTASVLKIFSGYISDRIGKRKWLTASGYGLSAISKPMLYFASSWAGVLGVRFADRTGKGIRTAPRDALIADSVKEEQRGLSFGLHRAADTGGAMLGLVIAAFVIWGAQAGLHTLTRDTFQKVVLFSVIPGVLGVLSVVIGAQEVGKKPGLAKLPSLSLRGFDNRFRAFLFILILFTLGNSSDAFLILRAQERGLSVLQVMGMLITFNLIYALLSTPAGALSDRVGRSKLIIGGWFAYSLVYLGFAMAGAGWQVWVFYALYGIYYGLVEGTARAFVADLVYPEQRGTAYGVYNAAVGLTAFPASLVAGILWQGIGRWAGFGPSAPFFFGAGMALTAVFLLGIWFPNLKKPK